MRQASSLVAAQERQKELPFNAKLLVCIGHNQSILLTYKVLLVRLSLVAMRFAQYRTDVKISYANERLRRDNRILFFFKFPPAFKVSLPHIIGNYNPDWGVVRRSDDGKVTLELVRETKGDPDTTKLRFANEGRKIISSEKHFAALGIDYCHITPDTLDWYLPASAKSRRFEGLK